MPFLFWSFENAVSYNSLELRLVESRDDKAIGTKG
jgi:hypothetical protein